MGGQPLILVPLDGSPVAEAALDVAGPVATSRHACLVLLRVVEPISQRVRAYAPRIVDEIVEAELAEANGYLGLVAGRLGRREGVSTRVVVGTPGESIASVADCSRVDLVIMTTRGQGSAARPSLGSVAVETLRRVTVPVLLIRPAEMIGPVPPGANLPSGLARGWAG